MKACKLQFNGHEYYVSTEGAVMQRIGQAIVPSFNDYVPVSLTREAEVLAEVKRLRHNKARRSRDQAMRDLGMVKVRGALGGTYWE